MRKGLFLIFCLLTVIANAQREDDNSNFENLTFSGYVELYYLYDFAEPENNFTPGFMFNHNRHNEVNLNLGFIKANYDAGDVRANLALMTGTYAGANLAHEPGFLRNIFEANAGVKLLKNHNLWVDAGVFESHIGFESAIGQNCRTLTRGILAENSPYYEAGVKLSYTSKNEKWFAGVLLLNGWQRITRVDGNSLPAFGHELTFAPKESFSITSSSFIGSEFPDNDRRMRYFHNLYAEVELSERLNFVAGFDIGAEQDSYQSANYNIWYTPVIVAQLNATQKLSFAARAEYYSDPENVIVSGGFPAGFETFGYSVNSDVALRKNVHWRMECRTFQPRSQTNWSTGNYGDLNFFAGTALTVKF